MIVIPAYNEEESVGAVIRAVHADLPDVDCVVVDDGSRDRTAAEAEAAGARVLRLPFNLGVGGAMRLGFQYAKRVGYGVVVQIDADGQHNPEDVPRLLDALAECDIAIGARFAGVGDYRVRGPRRWAMRMLSAVISRVAGTRLTDTTSGFRACGPRAVDIFAENYPAEYLGDTIEALVIAARQGCVLRQVPVVMNERVAGKPSHDPIRAAIYLGRASISLVFALLRPRSKYAEATVST